MSKTFKTPRDILITADGLGKEAKEKALQELLLEAFEKGKEEGVKIGINEENEFGKRW
jgi:hypothetical protein